MPPNQHPTTGTNYYTRAGRVLSSLCANFSEKFLGNSLLHGLKNKGYRSKVRITARKTAESKLEILISDTGSGFAEGKKAAIDQMLLTYAKQPAKLEGNSIGILNVQKRIKLLFDWQAHDCEVVGEASDGMEALAKSTPCARISSSWISTFPS